MFMVLFTFKQIWVEGVSVGWGFAVKKTMKGRSIRPDLMMLQMLQALNASQSSVELRDYSVSMITVLTKGLQLLDPLNGTYPIN